MTRSEFAVALTALRERAGLTVRDVAKVTAIQASTVGGYFSGRHLPPLKLRNILPDVLRACGVSNEAVVQQWEAALLRVRRSPGPRSAGAAVPYRGLACYEPEDAEWFFGRESLTQQLVERMAAPGPAAGGVLLVVGPSGVGKSSLLRAGLVAALGGVAAGDGSGPTSGCRLFTPGPHPVESLRSAMGDGLRPADGPLVLVIDQFEEVFTACDDEVERREFIAEICDLDRRPYGVRVVLGLRADFYAPLLGYPELVRAAQDAQLVVGSMSDAELRSAIERPAHKAKVEIEPGLVELVLRDLHPSAGRTDVVYEPGALPLLSHLLLAIWTHGHGRRLSVAGYAGAGGIDGAVRQTAENVYSGLAEAERAAARRLFVRLVIVSDEAADTRRRVPVAELGCDLATEKVIEAFVDSRLITADAETLEISHEALIPAWPRLRSWIDADRTHLLVGQQVAEAANRWAEENRDPGALYRGVRLAAAREWAAASGPIGPTSRQAEFLSASFRNERRETRRLYQSVMVLIILLVAAVVAGGVALQQRAEATNERNAAISRLVAGRADRVRDKDVALAAQLSLAAYRIAPTAEALASVLDTSATNWATRLLGGPGVMQTLALTPDRRTLAAAGADRLVRLWNISDPGRPVMLTPPISGSTDTVFAVAFSPDGRTLAAAGGDKVVHLWDVTDRGRPVPIAAPLTGSTALIYSLAFSPDGRSLVAGGGDFLIHRWDVTDRTHPTPLGSPLAGATSYVQAVAFSPDGRILAAGSDDKTVRLWDMSEPGPPRQLGGPLVDPTRRIYSVAFSPDGRTLAAGSADSHVYLWDLADPARPRRVAEPVVTTGWVNSVAFSPDGAQLAFATSSSSVRVWSLRTEAFTADLPHPGPVTAVVFDGDNAVVTAAADGTARIWPLTSPVLADQGDTVNGLAFSPDGRTLAIGSGGTQLWSVDSRRQLSATISNPAKFSTTVAFTPDGRTLAVGSGDGTVQLWNITDPTTPSRVGPAIAAHDLLIEALTFSPNGHLLATGSDDTTVRLWDTTAVDAPRLLATMRGFTSYVYSIAFSPDGRTLAAASTDKTVRLWNVADPGTPIPLGPALASSDHYALAVAFSPDGHTLAIGSGDKTIRLFDLADPTHPTPLGEPLGGPTNYVYALAYNADGTRLAAASTDESVWLWDVSNRRHPAVAATLTVPTGPVYTVGFSPNGHTLAAGGGGRTVWLWETDPTRVIAQICGRSGDPITPEEWARYIPGLDFRTSCLNRDARAGGTSG